MFSKINSALEEILKQDYILEIGGNKLIYRDENSDLVKTKEIINSEFFKNISVAINFFKNKKISEILINNINFNIIKIINEFFPSLLKENEIFIIKNNFEFKLKECNEEFLLIKKKLLLPSEITFDEFDTLIKGFGFKNSKEVKNFHIVKEKEYYKSKRYNIPFVFYKYNNFLYVKKIRKFKGYSFVTNYISLKDILTIKNKKVLVFIDGKNEFNFCLLNKYKKNNLIFEDDILKENRISFSVKDNYKLLKDKNYFLLFLSNGKVKKIKVNKKLEMEDFSLCGKKIIDKKIKPSFKIDFLENFNSDEIVASNLLKSQYSITTQYKDIFITSCKIRDIFLSDDFFITYNGESIFLEEGKVDNYKTLEEFYIDITKNFNEIRKKQLKKNLNNNI